MTRTYWIVALFVAASGLTTLAQAQHFPTRPIRMVVGFAPGGATDIIARSLGPGLTEALGQQLVVENRPGASSQIAGQFVAKSPPDGHVLMMMTQTLFTSQLIEGKSYPDILRDFSHVALTATSTLILVVNPSFPVKTLKELIALAKARPGEINYASGGVGTTPHLSGELMATMAKLKIVPVQYKGEAPALIDVMGGHVPFMFSNITASMTFVQSGKLRALATTGLKPSPALPRLPTMAASGLPGFEVLGIFGVLAPAGTPRDTVERLNAEIVKALGRADIKERFAAQALDPANISATAFTDFLKTEVTRWGRLIKEAGIK